MGSAKRTKLLTEGDQDVVKSCVAACLGAYAPDVLVLEGGSNVVLRGSLGYVDTYTDGSD